MAKKGGAWKVAYADFATAMMAFFLVMWITGQSKPIKQSAAEYFDDPFGVKKGKLSTSVKGPKEAVTHGRLETGRGPAKGLAMGDIKSTKPPKPRGVAATKPPRMMIFHDFTRTRSLGTGVVFAGDSADLGATARARLDALIPLLLGKMNKVEIQGYTATPLSRPEDGAIDPWRLCYERCQSTMNYLTLRGIDPERIQLCLDGEMESNPAANDRTRRDEKYFVEVFATDVLINR